MSIVIRTTDLTKKKLISKEIFLEKKITVITRSGLHPLERNLIPLFGQHDFGNKVLFIENRTGAAPLAYKQLNLSSEVTTFNLDIHHSYVIQRTIDENKMEGVTVLTGAYLPADKFFESIFLQAPHDMETELLQDLIQNASLQLVKGGRLILLHQGKSEFIIKQLKALFGGYTNLLDKKKTSIEIAKKQDEKVKLKSFLAEFEVHRLGKEPLVLWSIPGVFAHRRVDGGAQAMIDLVQIAEGQKLLDMGCGCGSIGITVSKDVANTEIHFVDSSARAIYITQKNCERNGLTNIQTHLSHTGVTHSNYFDIFIGNPPYFSDFKIAELFLETAWQALKKGGIAYVVAKTIDWHEEFLKQKFGNCEVIARRGYKIAKAVK